uniref:Uncharacterized protein n=1 Tax=Lepeophtheirus salmonis TaxID=72036 RepID=A0A0K2TVF0_LEPSM
MSNLSISLRNPRSDPTISSEFASLASCT